MTIDDIKKAIREIEIAYDYNHSKNDYDIVLNLTELAILIKNLKDKIIVDNVVEELEKEAERWEDSGKDYNDSFEIAVGKGLRKAIEIVKHCGVSDDVCEWHKQIKSYYFKPSCQPYIVFNARCFKYCPYCGKKIKEVE